MDDTEIKALAYFLAEKLKMYYHQTLAYRHVIGLLRGSVMPGVDKLVEAALEAPDIQEEADRVLGLLDEKLPPLPEIDLNQIQRLLLEKWESGEKKPN